MENPGIIRLKTEQDRLPRELRGIGAALAALGTDNLKTSDESACG